jgi:transposase-like protein
MRSLAVKLSGMAAPVQAFSVCKCLSCGRTFTATRGTIFYRRRTAEAEILECLALLAEGSRISSVSRVKGRKEDTIAEWLLEAAGQVELVENALLSEFRISRGQLDGLWSACEE